jgi:hypothetical protein
MSNLKEFINGASLFSAIQTVNFFPFFEGNENILDLMLVTNYGNKQVFEPFEVNDINSIATMLVLNFKSSWESYVKMGVLLENPNDRREVTETIDRTEERLNSNDSIDKVSAFNSNTMIDDKGSSVSGTDDLTGLTTRTLTDEQINVTTMFNRLSSTTRNSIVTSVLDDIAGYLTLSIY